MTKIIGIAGKKGHGKDAAALCFIRRGFVHLRFADPLKLMLRTFYRCHGVEERDIQRKIDGGMKELPCMLLNGKTPRAAMQTLGFEWGRQQISPSLWVDSCITRAGKHDKVVIPDVRFANECAAIQNAGGSVILVDASERVPDNAHSQHASETGVLQLEVDYTVANNGDLAALHKKIDDLELYAA